MAEKWNVSREEQDQFAANSQSKAGVAIKEGHFDKEIVPVSIPGRKGQVTVVDKDEFPKPETTAEGLSKLRPAFASVKSHKHFPFAKITTSGVSFKRGRTVGIHEVVDRHAF